MSKILDASCVNNEVTIEGIKVEPVTIITQGKKASTGFAIIQGDKVYYVTSNASDLADAIESVNGIVQKLQDVLDQVVLALTSLDSVTTVPGSAAAAIALVTTKNLLVTTENQTFFQTKDQLK